MNSQEQIARAFSGHQFTQTYPNLAADIRWVLVGGPTIQGRDDVIAACAASAAEFAQGSTDFTRFFSVAGADAVAVDTVGRYVSEGGTSVVSSCDIYEFDGEMITSITSYAVELPAD
ncbi:MAG: nuclear transport factor 2 family protein [Nakamurella sp.]